MLATEEMILSAKQLLLQWLVLQRPYISIPAHWGASSEVHVSFTGSNDWYRNGSESIKERENRTEHSHTILQSPRSIHLYMPRKSTMPRAVSLKDKEPPNGKWYCAAVKEVVIPWISFSCLLAARVYNQLWKTYRMDQFYYDGRKTVESVPPPHEDGGEI